MNQYPLVHPLRLINENPENLLNIVEGQGIYVKDKNGKVYIDGISGLWNVSMGYNHPDINESIISQLKKISFVNLGNNQNPTSVELGYLLLDILPSNFTKVFYTCTGSESIELAIKIAREYFHIIGNSTKKEFAVFDYSYHGTYYGSMSASGLDKHITEAYAPKVEGFYFLKTPYKDYQDNDIYEFFKSKSNSLAGVIIEPIIGSGGIIPLSQNYIDILKRVCEEFDILLIVDEVATGFGRTGKFFGFEHYNISPDIVCMAKGINSGYLPLGAVSITDKIARAFIERNKHVEHLSTQNGNPLACAAGIATIRLLKEPGFIENISEVGQYLLDALKERLYRFPFVTDIRGKGLMVGIEISSSNSTFIDFKYIKEIILEIQKKGLIVYPFYSEPLTAGISLFPPLIVTKKEIDQMVNIISNALRKITI
jgi:adenosylmethionine-8-amino-7-oxononanoate aminotransferase